MASRQIPVHISQQFDNELNDLRANVLAMGGLVEDHLNRALTALSNEDFEAAEYVATHDYKVNALEVEIDETDLLFIDTWHCYEQLRLELRRHASKVKKYIAFHDTQTYGTRSEEFMGRVGSNGLLPAIIHFLIDTPNEWKFKIHRTNNNGLTVLERIS